MLAWVLVVHIDRRNGCESEPKVHRILLTVNMVLCGLYKIQILALGVKKQMAHDQETRSNP
jgi:hypothetical protein